MINFLLIVKFNIRFLVKYLTDNNPFLLSPKYTDISERLSYLNTNDRHYMFRCVIGFLIITIENILLLKERLILLNLS